MSQEQNKSLNRIVAKSEPPQIPQSLCHRKGVITLLPRIHIVFASKSPIAAILKRGPSDWAHLLLWDTSSDTVRSGAWLHGRIYEDGCSVSPNGKLFAYFATKHHGEKTRGVDYAWTAISKLPYLTALALWPRSDTWGGSASFVDNKTLIIDCPHWESLKTSDTLPKGFSVLPRWTGKDAPSQTLPPINTTTAYFYGSAGVDQSGQAFEYENGFLLRNGKTIIDFNNMKPQPEPSPEHAQTW